MILVSGPIYQNIRISIKDFSSVDLGGALPPLTVHFDRSGEEKRRIILVLLLTTTTATTTSEGVHEITATRRLVVHIHAHFVVVDIAVRSFFLSIFLSLSLFFLSSCSSPPRIDSLAATSMEDMRMRRNAPVLLFSSQKVPFCSVDDAREEIAQISVGREVYLSL